MTPSMPPNPDKVVLASTLHDPDGRFLPHIANHSHLLCRYFSVAVAATDSTDRRTLNALATHRVKFCLVSTGSIGDARRSAVQLAVTSGASAIFLCDFDRWLHWATYFPEELMDLPGQISTIDPQPWFVCLGRTARAFATHPRAQQEPEAATNRALELLVGHPVDAVAGAAWLSHEGSAIVLAKSVEPTAATDLEWPALIHCADPDRLAYRAMEGLEFETATYHADEIARAGGKETWVQQVYDRPEMWAQRLRLAADSVQALVRIRADKS